jgi:serine/threonine protein kinase/tetratricopeptide (TPR) repeat protein
VPAAAQLGRFRVLRALGHGGMGLTYLAYDEELDRKLAIKLVHPEVTSEPEAQARLRREAQALARLAHPNIVHVYEVGHHQGQLFVAMELIEGKTIAEWLEEAARPWREVVSVFRQAGEGLRAAHAAGLVHRDFKPGNVMIGRDGRVRVLDFGLAYLGDALPVDGDPTLETTARIPSARASAGARLAAASDSLTSPDAGIADATGDAVAARDTGDAGHATDSTARLLELVARDRCLPLTATGALMGTPAYMSPEQMACKVADARSDQFSFCVSLYEALYGERPYLGATLADLVASQERAPAPAPTGRARDVPGWLWSAIARGLTRDPARRWPSMDALLAALARDPAERRRRWLVAGGLGAGALALVVAVWLGVAGAARDAAAVCSGARAQLAGVWDAERQAAVASAMQATGLSFAVDTWNRTRAEVDRYAGAWVAAYTDACEDTAVRREQPEDIRARRVLCLDERRQALRSLTELLSQADATAVEKAVQAASHLPRIESCAELDYLEARIKPPEDPALVARVAALRAELTRAGELRRLGQIGPGLVLARELQEAAAGLDYAPIRAEALLRQGELEHENAEYERAEASLRTAFFTARAADHHEVAYRAAIELVLVVGSGLARFDDGHEWGRHAGAELARGSSVEDQALLLHALGATHYSQGMFAEAVDHFRRALALREQALGAHHPDVAKTLNNLGISLRELGKYEDAAAQLGRALTIVETALGPQHPMVAGTLNNLAIVFAEQGQPEKAARLYRHALTILEPVLGPDHPDLAHAVGNLGIVLRELGQDEEAAAQFRRALAIRERALGPEHPMLAYSLDYLGTLLVDQSWQSWQSQSRQRQLEEAAALHRRALVVRERGLGPEHPLMAESLTNLGIVLARQGRLEDALAHQTRALAILEKALGPDNAALATPLVELAEVQLARRRPAEALAAAERALALRSNGEGVAPVQLAQARFAVARALVARDAAGAQRDAGARTRALELARQAEETYRPLPAPVRRREREAVDVWLRENDLRDRPGDQPLDRPR